MDVIIKILAALNQEIIFLIAGISNALIAVYVFKKNPRNIVNIAFLIFVVGSAIWIGNIGLIYLTKNFFFNQFIFYGTALMFSGLVFFARVFPNQRKPSIKFYLFITIPAMTIMILGGLNLIVTGINVLPDNSVEAIHGPAHLPTVLIVTGYFITSVFFLFQNFQKSSARHRLQFIYLLAGIFILIATGIIFGSIFPMLGYHEFNALSPISSILFVSFTAYAIVRHQLMDIRVVIQRGLIYTSLLAIIIGFYLLTVHLLGILLQQTINVTILISAGIATLIGVFGVPYVERWFRRITDKIFFKDKYNYREAMHELTEMLHTSIDLEKIIEKTTGELKRILKTNTVHFSLTPKDTTVYSDREIHIQDNGTTLKVPIALKDKVTGIISIGKKLSGDPYRGEDTSLLKTFAYQVAIALERARLYEQIKRHAQELEEKVKERTIELERLQEGQKQIMLDISHELQTPLTVVKGELDLLKRQASNSKTFFAFEKSIDEVSKFITDLLRLAKLEMVPQEKRKTTINLSELVQEFIEYFEVTLYNNKRVKLVYDIEPNIILSGNNEELNELITNLASNAIKYSATNRLNTISIKLYTKNNRAILTIQDTGIGIDPRDTPRIFERFYRIKQRSDSHGTGLGLAIVKQVVERHDGSIIVKSTPNKGTIFIVTFNIATLI